MNAESDTIVVAQPTNRVSPVRLGREEDAGMALFPPGQLPSTQIPADWGQNDPTKPDYIKNKPEIPSKPSDIDAAAAQHSHAQADVTGLADALADKLDATKRNLLDYTSGTTLAPETAGYRAALNADGTFPTITDTAIPAAAAYYQFELELTVPSTVPSTITGPSGWTFLDGHGLPDPADLTGGETIYISCRMDCGATGKPVLASVWRVS